MDTKIVGHLMTRYNSFRITLVHDHCYYIFLAQFDNLCDVFGNEYHQHGLWIITLDKFANFLNTWCREKTWIAIFFHPVVFIGRHRAVIISGKFPLFDSE